MKPLLLLVDDNEEILSFLGEELSERYTILTAQNGRDALQLLTQEAVQLVVSDVMMPVMDGFELCRIIKSTFEHCHIPVILLTAKNTLQAKIAGLELGADAYIDKPFSTEFLLAQIASLLSNRSKLKDYFAHSPLVHIKTIAYSRADELFLEQLTGAIYENLEDPELDIDKLAKHMNMSRPTLYRKIKSISDLTPNELVNVIRLKKAAELLVEGSLKIYEVSDMVGYHSQTNFGRNFLKQFGMTPSEYQAMKQAEKQAK
ncbi:response regulator [Chitinophaga tropicalis]|uniref:Response regulator n=1 Tax=Chitinophaga tropicalis TaxID=2683588 RepID=A0A7K1U0G7_9BACT|nr:response regulator [Chitinophaga tropicalis]MVT07859.1 response regulator [Chitinophaga tropicalis]